MNLKNIILKERNYEILRKTYITVFIAAVLTRVLLPIALCETQLVNSLVFAIVALFGAAIITIDIFTRRVCFSAKNVGWLVTFLAICALSSLVNAKYGIVGNIRNLVWLAISFFLLYPVDEKRTLESVKNEIRYLGNILVTVWFLACSVSMVMFILQIGYYVDVFPDSFARLGFIEGRLFGIFEDPNCAAIVALVTIILAIFNIKQTNKWWHKTFYVLALLVNFCYMVLSGSRTAEVAAITITFLAVYFVLLKKYNEKKIHVIFKQIIMILTGVFCSLVLIVGLFLTKKTLVYLPEFVSSPFESASLTETRAKKNIDITRKDVTNSTDVSNCRFKIWLSAIELFLSKPILGTSPRNMRTYAKAEFPDGFIAKRSYAVHNAYLDILTSTGILGAISMCIFLIKYLIDVFKFLFLRLHDKNYFLVLFSFLIVATVAISSFFLSEIFFVSTIGVLVFWLNLGYSYFFMKKSAEQERVNEI